MHNDPGASSRPAARRRRKWIPIVAYICLGFGITLFLTLAILVHRASGILRHRIINTLSTRYHGRVVLPRLEVSVLSGFEVNGGGLQIWPDALHQKQPLVSVEAFRFHTAWWSLLRSPMHVNTIAIHGLALNLPPKDERQNIPSGKPPGEEAKKHKIEIIVDSLDVDQGRFVLGNNNPGKSPLVFRIENLHMHRVGRRQPMRFHVTLINPKPIGNIDSSGTFGPFNPDNAGDSPVNGTYSFSHADLNTIHGIGGMLSSTGNYHGRLDHIVVDGKTDTPNFSIDVSGKSVPLRTTFHAIVDGTNGNTYLQPVDAYLRGSHIVATGSVERVKGKGHLIQLHVLAGHPADIYDMLDLAMKTSPPLMHGQLQLDTTLELPPGKQRVAEKLRLQGHFDIRNATFTNPKFQSAVDDLSLRGQGKPQDVKLAKQEHRKIESDMRGDFKLENGRLTVKGLHYNVPGAAISMQGAYSMDGKEFAFYGHVRMQAKVSQMVTGWWKKLLLMPVDPILSGKGAGTVVPIEVTGTTGSPKIGLDLGHHPTLPSKH